jgi:O-acetyl-ADP-ribose deacetylase (regulator of RNase III)
MGKNHHTSEFLAAFGLRVDSVRVEYNSSSNQYYYIVDFVMENTLIAAYQFPSQQVVSLIQGDLTLQKVDAIVNSANARLRHGGGVAHLILRRGGKVINQESKAWLQKHGPVTHSKPAYTSGGDLDCPYVIHAVGPVWGRGDEDDKLKSAIEASLKLAEELSLESIAFSAISTGIFGFPKKRAATVFYQVFKDYFKVVPDSRLVDVRIVVFDEPTTTAFAKVWKKEFVD